MVREGGGRAPPALTSQGYFFHHDGIVRQKAAVATLCVLCVSNKEKKQKPRKGRDFSQAHKF